MLEGKERCLHKDNSVLRSFSLQNHRLIRVSTERELRDTVTTISASDSCCAEEPAIGIVSMYVMMGRHSIGGIEIYFQFSFSGLKPAGVEWPFVGEMMPVPSQ
jgi:hypothetical protein